MSQKSRSISDILKSTPIRGLRQPLHNDQFPPRREPVFEQQNSDNTEMNDTEPQRSVKAGNESESILNRLQRLHRTDPPLQQDSRKKIEKEHNNQDEEMHRATSRQKSQRKQYESEESEEDVRDHRRKPYERFQRRGRDDESEESENESIPSRRNNRRDDDEDDEDEPIPRRRNSRRNSDEEDELPRRQVRKSPVREISPKSSFSSPTRQRRDYSSEEEEYVKRRSPPPAKRKEDELEDEAPRRSRTKRSSGGSNESFSSLQKATITKISKGVGIQRLGSDVYDLVRDMSGQFINHILLTASKHHDVITSAELEPIMEQYLGRQVEDLEQSDLNATTCIKWIKQVCDRYRITLKNEALLSMCNAIEFHIVCLFENAKDIARRGKRMTIGAEDLNIASRMK